jgi:hypothetical protein
MRRKKIIWSIIAVVLVVCAYFVMKMLNLLPSKEMLALRQIEQQLHLPVSAQRAEIDEGPNTDYKGATHYTRYIRFYYDDASLVQAFVDRLPNEGWEETDRSISGDDISYHFINKNNKGCLFANIDRDATHSHPHYIFIKQATDDVRNGCNVFFR